MSTPTDPPAHDFAGLARLVDRATEEAAEVLSDTDTDGLCEVWRRDGAAIAAALRAAEGMRAELALWKPLTPEEAEAELEKAEGVPLSDERIAEMVRFATDPANVLPNNQQMQLAADNKRLRADLAAARAELERVKAELADDAAASAELARMPPLTLEDVDKIKRAASRAEGGGK